MLDLHENASDRRPAVLVCSYEADDPVWDVIGGEPGPAAVRLHPVERAAPAALAEHIRALLQEADCRALLIVGRTHRSDGFRVQMRAENRDLDGSAKLSPTGPGLARATAPVAEMVRALNQAGLVADATSDSEDDVGSYLLYRVLTDLPDAPDTPSIGLLRASGSLSPDQLRLGVHVAAAAMARHLSPLPRRALG